MLHVTGSSQVGSTAELDGGGCTGRASGIRLQLLDGNTHAHHSNGIGISFIEDSAKTLKVNAGCKKLGSHTQKMRFRDVPV